MRYVELNQCINAAGAWTLSLSDDDIEIRYSCNSMVWCSHFHVWCKLFVRYRIPKQSLLHLFGITSIVHVEKENQDGSIAIVSSQKKQKFYLVFESLKIFVGFSRFRSITCTCTCRCSLSLSVLVKRGNELRDRTDASNWMVCSYTQLLHSWLIAWFDHFAGRNFFSDHRQFWHTRITLCRPKLRRDSLCQKKTVVKSRIFLTNHFVLATLAHWLFEYTDRSYGFISRIRVRIQIRIQMRVCHCLGRCLHCVLSVLTIVTLLEFRHRFKQ